MTQVQNYNNACVLLGGTKFTYDCELWTKFVENYIKTYGKNADSPEIVAANSKDPEKTLKSLKKNLLRDLYKNSDIISIQLEIKQGTRIVETTLKNIYEEIENSNVIYKRNNENSWTNWKMTAFKHWMKHNCLGKTTVIKYLNKYRFINFHIKFFKNIAIEEMITYEIGAKLLLFLLNQTTLKREKIYNQIKFCIICMDMINNSENSKNDSDFFNEFKTIRQDIWEKWQNTLTKLRKEESILTLNKHLYEFFDEEMISIKTNVQLVQLIDTICLDEATIRFYLNKIYNESYSRF